MEKDKNKRKCPVYAYYIEELGRDILDCCCGSRMFWYNKNNPDVLFGDIRDTEEELKDGRVIKIHPDLIMDFTNLPLRIISSGWWFLTHPICCMQGRTPG